MAKVKVLEDGTPALNVESSSLKRCEKGFHIKNSKCECSHWAKCPIRTEEIKSYKENEECLVRKEEEERKRRELTAKTRRYY